MLELRNTPVKRGRNVLGISLVCWTIASLANSQTKIGDATVAMQPGECRSLLNGVDIGCPKGAVYSAFQNGRHLVNFAATDIASIGFAGLRLQMTGYSSSILWLDGAYINQQRYSADGQCSFKPQAGDGVILKCSAILSDGRKLSASLNAAEQKETFLGVESLSKQRVDCEKLIGMHGMLTRAQFQCNFSKYSNELLDEAKRCIEVLGSDAAEKHLRSGMELFDYNEGKRGHDAMCKSVLANFPTYVRK